MTKADCSVLGGASLGLLPGSQFQKSALDIVCTMVHTMFMKLTVKVRRSEPYVTADGKKPYDDWLWKLKDLRAKARVAARVDRAARGNFGDYRDLHSGVFELRDDFGPGYRIYFGVDGDEIIVLLAGGDKGSQSRDILNVKEFWTDYLWRKQR